MQPITVYLPEQTLQTIDKLVKAGLYLNKGEAIRLILTRAVEEEAAAIEKIGFTGFPKQSPILKAPEEPSGVKHLTIAFRVPVALYSLMKIAAKRLGLRSRSELIRVAVIDFIMKRYRGEG
jgi:metal-responsive CopG/Arc/MetJ family transcriptional regulator